MSPGFFSSRIKKIVLVQKLDFLLVLFVTAAEMAAADLATKDWLFHTSASGTQLGMQLIIFYLHFFQ
jgi:hypothetical protein